MHESSQQRSRLGLTCNIDRAGTRARGAAGAAFVVAGLTIAVWAILGAGFWAWIGAAACMLAGAFALFEAANGWCAVMWANTRYFR